MKRFLALLLATIMLVTLSAPISVSADTQKATRPTIKILSIGHSYAWNSVEYLRDIADSQGFDLTVGVMYRGNCPLRHHLQYFNENLLYGSETNSGFYLKYGPDEPKGHIYDNEYSLSMAVTDEDWDYIMFQECLDDAGNFDVISYSLPTLKSKVSALATNPNVKYMWHEIWALEKLEAMPTDKAEFVNYNFDQATMYNAVKNATNQVFASDMGISGIVHTGEAFYLARKSGKFDPTQEGGVTLVADVVSHANHYGKFLAGLVWFMSFTGCSVSKSALNIPSGMTKEQAYDLVDFATAAVTSDGKTLESVKDKYGSQIDKDPSNFAGFAVAYQGGTLDDNLKYNNTTDNLTTAPKFTIGTTTNDSGFYSALKVGGYDGKKTVVWDGIAGDLSKGSIIYSADLTLYEQTTTWGSLHNGFIVGKIDGQYVMTGLGLHGANGTNTYVPTTRINGSDMDQASASTKFLGAASNANAPTVEATSDGTTVNLKVVLTDTKLESYIDGALAQTFDFTGKEVEPIFAFGWGTGNSKDFMSNVSITGDGVSEAHIYADDCDDTCDECGYKRKAPHKYDGNTDDECNVCGYERNLLDLVTINNAKLNAEWKQNGHFVMDSTDGTVFLNGIDVIHGIGQKITYSFDMQYSGIAKEVVPETGKTNPIMVFAAKQDGSIAGYGPRPTWNHMGNVGGASYTDSIFGTTGSYKYDTTAKQSYKIIYDVDANTVELWADTERISGFYDNGDMLMAKATLDNGYAFKPGISADEVTGGTVTISNVNLVYDNGTADLSNKLEDVLGYEGGLLDDNLLFNDNEENNFVNTAPTYTVGQLANDTGVYKSQKVGGYDGKKTVVWKNLSGNLTKGNIIYEADVTLYNNAKAWNSNHIGFIVGKVDGQYIMTGLGLHGAIGTDNYYPATAVNGSNFADQAATNKAFLGASASAASPTVTATESGTTAKLTVVLTTNSITSYINGEKAQTFDLTGREVVPMFAWGWGSGNANDYISNVKIFGDGVSVECDHIYDDEYDATCNNCEWTREVPSKVVIGNLEIDIMPNETLPVNQRVDTKFVLGWKNPDGTKYEGTTYAEGLVAEFVETKMMAVKYQLGRDGNSIRYIASIDETERYSSVGWVFSITNENPEIGGANVTDKNAKKVYSGIIASGQVVDAAAIYGGADYSKYLYVFEITDIPEADADTPIFVRPYVEMNDGRIVYGDVSVNSLNKLKK